MVGYQTTFEGRAKLIGEIPDGMIDFVNVLSHTRRMKRNVNKKFGLEGEYYTHGGGSFGQDKEDNVIDNNKPPRTQPGLWCQWVIVPETLLITKSIVSEEQQLITNYYIQWDGGEKFCDDYVEWMDYLISKVFHPYGVKLEGNIRWEGEDEGDVGEIYLFNNGSSQTMEADGHGYFDYPMGKSLPKLNFVDLLRKDKQIEFTF